jgi:RIO kinase 1
MWALFDRGELKPDAKLTGLFVSDKSVANVSDVMLAIDDAREEALRRQRGRDEAAGEN